MRPTRGCLIRLDSLFRSRLLRNNFSRTCNSPRGHTSPYSLIRSTAPIPPTGKFRQPRDSQFRHRPPKSPERKEASDCRSSSSEPRFRHSSPRKPLAAPHRFIRSTRLNGRIGANRRTGASTKIKFLVPPPCPRRKNTAAISNRRTVPFGPRNEK